MKPVFPVFATLISVLMSPVGSADSEPDPRQEAIEAALMPILECDDPDRCLKDLAGPCIVANGGEFCHLKYCFYPVSNVGYLEYAGDTSHYDLPQFEDLGSAEFTWAVVGFGIDADGGNEGTFGVHVLTVDRDGHVPRECA